jgi:hypothetical protein
MCTNVCLGRRPNLTKNRDNSYALGHEQTLHSGDFSEGALTPVGSVRRLTMLGMDNRVACHQRRRDSLSVLGATGENRLESPATEPSAIFLRLSKKMRLVRMWGTSKNFSNIRIFAIYNQQSRNTTSNRTSELTFWEPKIARISRSLVNLQSRSQNVLIIFFALSVSLCYLNGNAAPGRSFQSG